MKKHLFSLLLALCLCLTLAACSSAPAQESAAPSAQPETAQPALRQGDGLYAQPRRLG